MKQFVHTLFPKEFFTCPEYFRALTLSALYLGVAIAQLFTYEKFAAVVRGFGLPGGDVTANILSAVLPLVACAALPFLVSMRMGVRLRTVSRTAVIALPSLWLVLAVWLNFAPNASKLNAGIFGATIPTSVGIWIIAFTLLWVWAAVIVVRELPGRK